MELEADNSEQKEKDKKFDELMEIVTKLFDLKYLDVYQDDKEAIKFEITQDELLLKREKENEDKLKKSLPKIKF